MAERKVDDRELEKISGGSDAEGFAGGGDKHCTPDPAGGVTKPEPDLPGPTIGDEGPGNLDQG